MCGIVGLFDRHGRAPMDSALLERMTAALRHRGPDQGGTHIEPGLALGHRRLSIIDLSGGVQPLANEDGSVWVVYNGEVYNFAALAEELRRLGHRFRTHGDTEVLVHAWEEWGEACLERLRGMFAFAIWDGRAETLFLARDRLGIKPLYYAELPNGILTFASELKALLLHPALGRKLDPRAVEDYFAYGYVPDPKTILTGVAKLAPGHCLRIRRGDPMAAPRSYWDLPAGSGFRGSEADAEQELIARVREAVDIRRVAEVPLGAFLSGGVDSSAVVAMMASLSDDPVQTCSISFGEPEFDEASYAGRVASRYGTDHHGRRVDAADFELIDRLADLYDEPYADSSALPTYRLCELARRHVTVALSGDGGDETLAGYRRYRFHLHEQRLRSLLPGAMRAPLFGVLGRVYPKLDWAPRPLRAKATLQALARDPVAGFFHSVSVFGDPLRGRLFSSAFRRELQGYRAVEVLHAHARRCPTDDPLTRVQYLDLKTWLPGDILTKVDRASMAHSLEVRVPLLDHQLVEWTTALPARLKLRAGEGKYLLKRALRPYLSDDLLYRPKMGFSMPIAQWFRGPLHERLRQALLAPEMAASGVFDMDFVASLVDAHRSGRSDHSSTLWSLWMYAAFQRRVLNA